MKIYISGPMTGLPDSNKPAFNAEAARLREMGFEVVNPAEVDLGPKATWFQYMRADLKLMLDCDAIALLPGWMKSRGAAIEHWIARALGFQVFTARSIVGRSGEFPVLSFNVMTPAEAA
ncbi:DUF4406 domain-containing protein [Paraburkholderia azotifigens]|uniref:DUF4406 domain-containing protein n=1 Tax=Paraburkholderia azotifigens TaxID=2057004 RepID=UPI003175B563